MPVTVPAGSGVQDINLNNIEVTAGNGLSTQNADRCDAVVPINFTGDLPNQQVGSDVGEDIDGWFGGLLPDWETTGPALKFIYDLIPLVGDGTEVIVQAVNYFTGKGVDEVSATLAVIGFALDFPTDPVTVAAGGVISGSRTIFKLSKEGAGTLAEVISDIVLGPGRPLQKVESLREAMGTFVDILVDGGVAAVRNADEVASVLSARRLGPVTTDAGAVDALRGALDKLKNPPILFSGVDFDQARFLDAANTFKNAPNVNVQDGPLLKMAQGNGIAPYVELVGTKSLQDGGHTVVTFNTKVDDFDIDSLTIFNNVQYANQAKASLTLEETATIQAQRMNTWIQMDASSRVGQFILTEGGNPNIISREAWDAIKAVNPDIRIIDVDGIPIPRP